MEIRENYQSQIYVLTHPSTSEIRYVGGTTRTLESRLREHLIPEKKKFTHKGKWVAQLRKLGLQPQIVCVEVVDGHFAETEKDWIYFLRSIGTRLTNLTDGGQGVIGYKWTNEMRKRVSEHMSATRRGKKLSEEHKKKMSLAKLGKTRGPFSEEHKKRLSESQKARQTRTKVSEETRAKMSASQRERKRKKLSEEVKNKMSIAQKQRREKEKSGIVTRKIAQQTANNKTYFVEYEGERLPLWELCKRKNIPYSRTYLRIKRYGRNTEDAVNYPSIRKKQGAKYEPNGQTD